MDSDPKGESFSKNSQINQMKLAKSKVLHLFLFYINK